MRTSAAKKIVVIALFASFLTASRFASFSPFLVSSIKKIIRNLQTLKMASSVME